jgi:CDP-diacylglycerol--serine O-phosphatidyltransferase
MKLKKKYGQIYFLPTLLSLSNLFFGFLSVVMTFHARYRWAAFWIMVAAAMDGLDGIIARLTKGNSELGKELDSLADSVSFGLATALLLFFWGFHMAGRTGIIFSFLFLAAGVLRLARYNVLTTGQTDRRFYTGLTVPSAAIFMSSFVFFHPTPLESGTDSLVLAALTVFISFCMVSTMRYRNFMNVNFLRRIDFKTALFLAVIVGGLVFYTKEFLIGGFSLNVLVGPIDSLWRAVAKRRRKKVPSEKAAF